MGRGTEKREKDNLPRNDNRTPETSRYKRVVIERYYNSTSKNPEKGKKNHASLYRRSRKTEFVPF